MRAAVYARYSSDNQRADSIDDQVAACRRYAQNNGMQILTDHIYSDAAKSGRARDRAGVRALLLAAEQGCFDVILVDTFSRLARDLRFFLNILAETDYTGMRIISVSQGLDTGKYETRMAIHMHGVFSEGELASLRSNTIRGQMGKRERGSFINENAYGYGPVRSNLMELDARGRPVTDNKTKCIIPAEAAVVLRIFEMYVDGKSTREISRVLNTEGVPTAKRMRGAWGPSHIFRILSQEKYVGRWIWNRTATKLDPRSYKRRSRPKPESEWLIIVDEKLRIVPQELWDRVQELRKKRTKTWPGAGSRGCFSAGHGSREEQYPTHLLSGMLTCGSCGKGLGLVDGTRGGHYGCGRRVKGGCENTVTVHKPLLERLVLDRVAEAISRPNVVRDVFKRVKVELEKGRGEGPEKLRAKQAELKQCELHAANLIKFVEEGSTGPLLKTAIADAGVRITTLSAELESLKAQHGHELRVPPLAWIEDRLRLALPRFDGQVGYAA